MEDYNSNYLILAGVLLIILYFILRELNCWYWKINQRIELQKETNDLLRKLVNNQAKPVLTKKESAESIEQTSVDDPEVLKGFIDRLQK